MLLAAGCIPSGYAIKFRLKLSFLVDGERREGSSVRVVQLGSNGGGFPPSAIPTYGSILGEAAPVALKTGRHIFGLMAGYETVDGRLRRSDTLSLPSLVARRTSAEYSYNSAGRSEFLERLKTEHVTLSLEPDEWPMLGFFEDETIKETATLLPFNDIGQAFPGVSPLSAVLESTNDRVTKGVVERLLPWFADDPFSLSNAPSLDDHPEVLVPSDFVRSTG